MSKELKGQGEIAGTERYFKALNSEYAMSCIFPYIEKYDYYVSMKRLTSLINETFDMIYDDLKANAAIIRYIPNSSRSKITSFILDMCDICKKTNSSTGKSGDVINVLQLSDSMTRLKSNSSDYYLDKSFDFLRRGSFNSISQSDALELVKKAESQGVEYVVRDNDLYKSFFKDLNNGSELPNNDYLSDLIMRSRYNERASDFRGRNGKELCTNDYIQYFIYYIFKINFMS